MFGVKRGTATCAIAKHAASGPYCQAGPGARACALTERLRAPTRSSSKACAHSATSLDPQHGIVVMETWRQCIRSSITLKVQSKYWGLANYTLIVKRNKSLLQLVTFTEIHCIKIKFIFGHRLGKFILNKNMYLKTQKFKCDEIARGKFSTITESACLAGWKLEADNSLYGVYATRHWNWMNSYWMFWIGLLREARSVSSFCECRKIIFCDLTTFFSFLMRENLVFFRYSY